MNVKTTIILLILLILCVGYMLYFHTDWFGRQDKPEEVIEPDKRLAGDFGKIHRLAMERPGVEKIVIVRRDGKWRIIEPIEAPAAEWEVDAVAAIVSGLRYVQKHAGDDPQYQDDVTGLSAPLYTVSFTDEKGKTCTIKVGRNAPAPPGGRTYVQIAGDNHVFVVEADLHKTLNKTLTDYRQKYVARFDTDRAVRMEVRGDENYLLIRTGDKWAIDSPVSARADQEKVKGLLRAVGDIHAVKFVEDNPKDLGSYGLDKPRLLVTVELSEPKPKTATETPTTKPTVAKKPEIISVAFGSVANQKVFVKLAGKPWVFQVAESELEKLQPKLRDLRDRHVMDIAGKDISRIEITLSTGGSATLEKSGGKWRMLSPFKGDCEDKAIEELISSIRDLKVSQFRDTPTSLAAFGLEPPRGKILLHFRRSDKTSAMLLGRESSSRQMGFVKDARGKSVAVVTADELAKLSRPSPAYRSRTIFELPDDARIVRVDLDRPDGKFTVEKTGDADFKLTAPVTAETDSANVDALLEALKSIRADKIVVLNNILPKRFAEARGIRVRLYRRTPVPTSMPATAPATQPSTRPVKYRTSRAGSLVVIKDKGDSYVWMEKEAGPFVVGQLDGKFYDIFAAEMRHRAVLKKMDVGKIVSVKLDMEKTSMELVRSGQVWRYSTDTLVKVDAEKIKRFLSDLSALKADWFADYSAKPNLLRFGLDKPAMTITMKTDDNKKFWLKLSRTGPVGTKGLYASGSDAPGVFVLTPATQKKMTKSMKDFRKDSSP